MKLNTRPRSSDEGVTEALTTLCGHPVVFSSDPYSFKLKQEQGVPKGYLALSEDH